MLEFLIVVGAGMAIGVGFWVIVFAVRGWIANCRAEEQRVGLANDGDDWAPWPQHSGRTIRVAKFQMPCGYADPSQPDPGEGWRTASGDDWEDERCEHWNCDEKLWEPRKNVGMLFDIGGHYRIPDDAQPTPKRPDIEQQVCQDILRRQKLGIAKYGTTVAENPLELRAWLQHALEECLDQAIYLKRAIAAIDEQERLDRDK